MTPRENALSAYRQHLASEHDVQEIINTAQNHWRVRWSTKAPVALVWSAIFLAFILPIGLALITPHWGAVAVITWPLALVLCIISLVLDNLGGHEWMQKAIQEADLLQKRRHAKFLNAVSEEIYSHQINVLKIDQETSSFITDRGTITLVSAPESSAYDLVLNGQRIQSSYHNLTQSFDEAVDLSGKPVMVRDGYADLSSPEDHTTTTETGGLFNAARKAMRSR